MTGSEMLAYVKRKFKREDKDAEIYEAMTDVIADMCIQFYPEDFKEEATLTGTITLGEYKLPVPADFGHILGEISIMDTANESRFYPLTKISKIQYDQMYPDRQFSTTTNMTLSRPRHFCVYGNQIFIGPIPDKTTYQYQLNYTTIGFETVTASTDPVSFTDKYRNILRSGILSELHNGMENYEEAGYWKEEYLKGLSKIAANDDANTSDNTNASYSGF